MSDNYPFTHRLKVRWSEIDGQKIVFNAHYLTYLDITISEYFEEGLQLKLPELANQDAFDFVLVKSTLEYKSPARLGDWLNISCRAKSIGHTSFTIAYKITRESNNELILLAEIVYVSYDSKTGSAVPVPDFIRERMEAFEKV